MSTIPFSSVPRWSIVASATLAVALLFLPRMLLGSLRHWDEAWYAQVSREMLDRESIGTLYWNDAPWFHKPPLTFWGTMASFALFGESEWTARFFSVLCSLGTVAIISYVSYRWHGAHQGMGVPLLLASFPEFARYATRGQLDGPITFFLTAQLLIFWVALDRPRHHWLGGFVFGLGLMTKGAAAGLALIVEVAYIVASRDARPLRQPAWWLSWVIGLAIAAPWHVHQFLTHGEAFLKDYGARHFAQFFVDIYPEVDHQPAPWSYYLDFFIRKQPVWGWCVLALLAFGIIAATRNPNNRRLVFLVAWATAIPVALSFAQAKWHWYLVPMFPGLALLTGELVGLYAKSVRWFPAAAMCLAIVAASEVIFLPANREHEAEIAQIGEEIARAVPPGGEVLTLQTSSARTSIYPIAVRYYGRRTVRPIHGLKAMEETVRSSGHVLTVLLHERSLDELRRHFIFTPKEGFPAEVEIAGRRGEVILARLVPGPLAEEIRQAAARKNEVSR